MIVVPYSGVNQISIVASLFKEKNALTSENAINLTATMLVDRGLPMLSADVNTIKRTYTFLKINNDGSVWLNEKEYDEYIIYMQKKGKRMMKILVFGWLAVMALIIIGLVFFT